LLLQYSLPVKSHDAMSQVKQCFMHMYASMHRTTAAVGSLWQRRYITLGAGNPRMSLWGRIMHDAGHCWIWASNQQTCALCSIEPSTLLG
jgi:hypothetical protein